MAAETIRTLIADEASGVRMVLRFALQRAGGFEIVGEAADGTDAVGSTTAQMPDAVVLDVAMPAAAGLQAIPKILSASPTTKILAISPFTQAGLEGEALRLGAHAYLQKGEPIEKLVGTLRSLCDRTSSDREPSKAPAVLRALPVLPPPEPLGDPREMLAILVHELSNPISVIQGFAEALGPGAGSLASDDVARYIDAILRGARQLADIVHALADVRALDTGTLDLEPERIDLGGFVESVVNEMRAELDDLRVSVRADRGIGVSVDPTRMRRVLENIIGNAAKYGSAETPVEVAVRARPDGAEVGVRDYGPGIPDDVAENLFQKFSRSRKSASGLGLGLFIARGIARAHGGDLVHESPGGGGARFVLRLPRPDVEG